MSLASVVRVLYFDNSHCCYPCCLLVSCYCMSQVFEITVKLDSLVLIKSVPLFEIQKLYTRYHLFEPGI